MRRNKIQKIYHVITKFFKIEKPRKVNPLDILIATILSQNTNDLNSHRAFKNLKEKFPTFESILTAEVKEIEESIKIGGLASQKAKRIRNLLAELKKKTGTFDISFLKDMSIEDAMKFLTSFEGVGLKTASCVLLFGFNKSIFPVDTHIHRILNRVGVVKTKTPDQTFLAVQKLIPAGYAYQLHVGLIKFGRMVCRARDPLCGVCPIYEICDFNEKKFYKNKNRNDKIGDNANAKFILLSKI